MKTVEGRVVHQVNGMLTHIRTILHHTTGVL